MSQTKVKYLMIHLLPTLRALANTYQHLHWRSRGPNYYSDHQLYERLYGSLVEEIDMVAERVIGTFDDDVIGPGEDAGITSSIVNNFISDDDARDDYPEIAIKFERFVLRLIGAITGRLNSLDIPTDGIEDLLQGITSKHEEHLYLLQQRNKTSGLVCSIAKLANQFDEQGLYKEADILDQLIHKSAEDKSLPVEAEQRAPDGWWKKMEQKVKAINPTYTDKQLKKAISDIWDDVLSDTERKEAYQLYNE